MAAAGTSRLLRHPAVVGTLLPLSSAVATASGVSSSPDPPRFQTEIVGCLFTTQGKPDSYMMVADAVFVTRPSSKMLQSSGNLELALGLAGTQFPNITSDRLGIFFSPSGEVHLLTGQSMPRPGAITSHLPKLTSSACPASGTGQHGHSCFSTVSGGGGVTGGDGATTAGDEKCLNLDGLVVNFPDCEGFRGVFSLGLAATICGHGFRGGPSFIGEGSVDAAKQSPIKGSPKNEKSSAKKDCPSTKLTCRIYQFGRFSVLPVVKIGIDRMSTVAFTMDKYYGIGRRYYPLAVGYIVYHTMGLSWSELRDLVEIRHEKNSKELKAEVTKYRDDKKKAAEEAAAAAALE